MMEARLALMQVSGFSLCLSKQRRIGAEPGPVCALSHIADRYATAPWAFVKLLRIRLYFWLKLRYLAVGLANASI